MSEKLVEKNVYIIKCPVGHENEFRLGVGENFPKDILCPQRMPKGNRCQKSCEIKKVLKEKVPEPKTKKKVEREKSDDDSEYNLAYFEAKTTPEIAKLLKTCHNHVLSLGLKPTFRKHYISYTLGKKTVMRFGVGKQFMSMPFNSKENYSDDRIKDISHTVGDKFMYFWTKIVPEDLEMIKNIIHDAITYR
jgi:hypothetical protein